MSESAFDKVTVVMVTFESAHIIAEALEAIPKGLKVIVVDNNSLDDSAKIAAQLGVKVIVMPKNEGFGRANNKALNQIETPYALLLNPDAKIQRQAIPYAVEVLDNNPNIAIYGSNKKNTSQGLVDMPIIAGGETFLNMAIFKKIGFFDENLFLYCEDKELCWRARENGYRVVSDSGLEIEHEGNQSSHNNSEADKTKQRIHGQSIGYLEQKRKGKFFGTLYLAIKMLEGYVLSVMFQKHSLKQFKSRGILDYLIYGKSILFDNPFTNNKEFHYGK